MKFYVSTNNGVTGVVSEDVMRDINRRTLIAKCFARTDINFGEQLRLQRATRHALQHLSTPTFTFSREWRVNAQPWFTGSRPLLAALTQHIESMRHVIVFANFFVPFSNGHEIGHHGREAMAEEMGYVTTGRQFQETFGMSSVEILEKYGTVEDRLLLSGS